MIFQWYIFVLIFGIAAAADLMKGKEKVISYGREEERYRWAPALAIVLPLIYWAGTRADMNFGDTGSYRIGFRLTPDSLAYLPEYLQTVPKDKGFSAFNVLVKFVIGNQDVIYFLIIAAICGGCVFWVYRKYSCSFAMTAFLFVASADYLQWMYNGIRQFIAAAVCFACIGLILKKKYLWTILVICIMATFHASALLLIPVIFIVQGKPWNRKTLLFMLAVITAIAFLDQFTEILTNFMSNSQYSNEVGQFNASEGVNLLRVAVYAVPTVIALLKRNKINEANNQLINVCVNMSVVSLGFYILAVFTSGLFIGRLTIYFSLYNYILLPWEIKTLFDKRTATLISVAMIGFYLIYYYYQVAVVWGL